MLNLCDYVSRCAVCTVAGNILWGFLCSLSFWITFRLQLLSIIHLYTLVQQGFVAVLLCLWGYVDMYCILWAIRLVHEGCRHCGWFLDFRRRKQIKHVIPFGTQRSQWSDLWWPKWARFSSDGVNIFVNRGQGHVDISSQWGHSN